VLIGIFKIKNENFDIQLFIADNYWYISVRFKIGIGGNDEPYQGHETGTNAGRVEPSSLNSYQTATTPTKWSPAWPALCGRLMIKALPVYSCSQGHLKLTIDCGVPLKQLNGYLSLEILRAPSISGALVFTVL
jgi:hypothetical protein